MRLWRVAGLLSVVVACGCIRAEQNLSLNADGSGFYEVTYSIAESFINQARAMQNLRVQLETTGGTPPAPALADTYARLVLDPAEVPIRKALQRFQEKGLTIDKLTVDTRSTARQVHLKLLFKDLKQLAECDFFPLYGFELTRTTDGNYLIDRPPLRGPLPADSALSPAERNKLLAPVLGGFHVEYRVTLPGQVLKTNAVRSSSRNAAWVFDFDDDPTAFTRAQTTRMQVLLQGRGVTLPELRLPASAGAPVPAETAPPPSGATVAP